MARKKIELDWETVKKLCEMQCTQAEICGFLEISEDTLQRACKRELGTTWTEYFAEARKAGKISLRRAQWQKAVEKQDTTMLIFLGKNFLGQSDKIDNTITNNTDAKLSVDLSKFSKEELMEMLDDEED